MKTFAAKNARISQKEQIVKNAYTAITAKLLTGVTATYASATVRRTCVTRRRDAASARRKASRGKNAKNAILKTTTAVIRTTVLAFTSFKSIINLRSTCRKRRISTIPKSTSEILQTNKILMPTSKLLVQWWRKWILVILEVRNTVILLVKVFRV